MLLHHADNISRSLANDNFDVDHRYLELSQACGYKRKRKDQKVFDEHLIVDNHCIELALACAYSTDMIRPYHVAETNIQELTYNCPSKRMFELLKDQFGSITGSCGKPRISPTGINHHHTYLKEIEVTDDGYALVPKYEADKIDDGGASVPKNGKFRTVMNSVMPAVWSNTY